jgi:hypothetical protein
MLGIQAGLQEKESLSRNVLPLQTVVSLDEHVLSLDHCRPYLTQANEVQSLIMLQLWF